MAPRIATALVLASSLWLLLAAPVAAAPIGVSGQLAVERPPERTERAATSSSLIAGPEACPEQGALSSSTAAQLETMLCMTNFARVRAGLGPLAEAAELDRSAERKAGDVLRCDSFSHFACGREFTYWIRAAGYIGEGCWRAGENLAWGIAGYGSVRSIFRAWMSSPTHRQNILGDFEEVGIGVVSGPLESHSGARVWVSHFGTRC